MRTDHTQPGNWAYAISRARAIQLPAPSFARMTEMAQYLVSEDPTFPLPTPEQWAQLDPRMQRLVYEMLGDATQHWLFDDCESEANYIRDIFAQRFSQ